MLNGGCREDRDHGQIMGERNERVKGKDERGEREKGLTLKG